MAASFNCPHCEATYPALPTLYGRTVRCSTCKKPFRLRGDGVVEKVTAAKDPTRVHKRERTEEEKENLTRAFISKSKETQQQQKPATRRLERRRKNLQELKSSVSTALNQAASDAIAVEAKKEPERPAQRKPLKEARDSSQPVSAVLTGQGHREQKQTRTFLIGCSGFIIICIILLSLLDSENPAREALEAFVAPTDFYNQAAKRALAYRQRAWLIRYDTNQQPSIILNIDKAELEAPVEYNLTIPATVIEDNLYGLSHFREWCLWAEPDKHEQIKALWNEYDKIPPLTNFYGMLSKAGIQHTTYEQIVNALKEKEIPEEIRMIFYLFLAGQTDQKGNNKWQSKMLSDHVPHHCSIVHFHGTDGREFQAQANRARYIKLQAYTGSLLRFNGEGWDPQWRLLTAHGHDRNLYNPLLEYINELNQQTFREYDLEQQRLRDNENRPEDENLEPE